MKDEAYQKQAAKVIGDIYSDLLNGEYVDADKKLVQKYWEYVNNGADEKRLMGSLKNAYESNEYTDPRQQEEAMEDVEQWIKDGEKIWKQKCM